MSMRRFLLFAVLFLFAASAGAAQQEQQSRNFQVAVGVVFHDANLNGVRDEGEKGLADVRVSNGRIIVRTDQEGGYRIPVDDDTIIFVIKPRNWRTQVDENNVPRFYYIHKPKGSPELKYEGVAPTGPLPASVDFPLYPNPEPDRFQAIFLGDTQVTNEQEIAHLAHDIIEEIVGTDAAFAVSLGDIANDDLSVYEPLLPVMGKLGIRCHYIKGNHDSNYDGSPDNSLVDETYERYFGPSHYSFDYGPVHFVALDNIYFVNGKKYVPRLDFEQMTFLRSDLAAIPKDQLVVLMMHNPMTGMDDRNAILRLMHARPYSFSISADWHVLRHIFVQANDVPNNEQLHHHFVNVTACGSWWRGWPDEVGIPHTTMRDGKPNGYSIITFDGSSYSIKFKAARRPANYQMNIYAPDVVEASKAGETEILANVFAGSERSKVEMRLKAEDPWIPMEQNAMQDPAYVRTKQLEDRVITEKNKQLTGAFKTPHIWKANLPKDATPGTYLLQVRTTDMFGQTYTGNRVINIR